MDNWPRISIVVVTYRRTEEATQTIRSICKYLTYPKDLRSWYIGDDGSPKKHVDALLKVLREHDEDLLGWHNERIRKSGHEDSYNAGAGWNKALGIAHQNSDFVLWVEDDWLLREPFDIRPYIQLLSENEQVGIVTFRTLSVGADLHSVGYDGVHYMNYLKTTQYAYSGNPYLRHARFTKHFGWFAEDRSPGNIELDMDSRFRIDPTGPQIWRPAGIDPWGVFAHVGTDKTWE